MDLMELMNYNHDLGLNGKDNFESKLGEIQIMISKAFVSEPRTNEEIAKFESDLYGDSRVFGDNAASYSSLDNVYETWNELKSQIVVKDLENSKSK